MSRGLFLAKFVKRGALSPRRCGSTSWRAAFAGTLLSARRRAVGDVRRPPRLSLSADASRRRRRKTGARARARRADASTRRPAAPCARCARRLRLPLARGRIPQADRAGAARAPPKRTCGARRCRRWPAKSFSYWDLERDAPPARARARARGRLARRHRDAEPAPPPSLGPPSLPDLLFAQVRGRGVEVVVSPPAPSFGARRPRRRRPPKKPAPSGTPTYTAVVRPGRASAVGEHGRELPPRSPLGLVLGRRGLARDRLACTARAPLAAGLRAAAARRGGRRT